MSGSNTARDINRITGAIIKVSLHLIIYALVILIFYEGITAGYRFGHEIFSATAVAAPPGWDRMITIGDGKSDYEVGKLLEKEGLIHNRFVFAIQAELYDYELYPGVYRLNTSMTSREILDVLSEEPKEEEGEPKT